MKIKEAMRNLALLDGMLLAILVCAVGQLAARDQIGLTPKQLSGLTAKMQALEGEITDLRLLDDRLAAVVVSADKGWQLYVFSRGSGAEWKQDWSSGPLGNMFATADPHWKVYFSSCGPLVLEFDGCRAHECGTAWGSLVYDVVSRDVVQAQMENGRATYKGKVSGCARQTLEKVVVERSRQ